MNWSKGAKTRGRGTSFKGALDYYLHDKDTMETAERVGFVHMLNLVTDDPYDAWREMMLTAESADRLKRESGHAPAKKKNEQPVYCFSIEWHPDDHPTKKHMLETALDVVGLLKMEEHQIVIVEHLDEPHPHLHFTVNMMHPETGMSLDLYEDEERLGKWADEYEVRMGVIRSPNRRAYYAAIEQGLPPPKRVKQPKHYNNPAAKAAIANDNTTAQARARAIQDDYKAYAARLKTTQADNWKRRKQEQRQLWNDYRTARQAIRARHQFQMDQIYRHLRNRHALPLSIQGFRDWKETREWKKLMERLKAEKRRFEYRERTLFGFVGNAIALLRPGMQRSGRGLLPVLFNLLVSGKARRELLLIKQGLTRKALSEKQFGSRKVRADRIRLIRDAQLEALSHAYDIQKQALDMRHEREIAAQKHEWQALSIERKRLWQQWEAEFGPRVRRRQSQGSSSGDSGDTRAPAPRRPNQQFAHAAPAGKRMAQKTGDSAISKKFEQEARPDPPAPKPGYKQRRSAAQRKADGTYKPRQRKGPTP
jgi:hypothetical protein